MRVLLVQGAEAVPSECFHCSPEVPRGHRLPREEVHAAVALPITVVPVLYQDKAFKNETEDGLQPLKVFWNPLSKN